MSKLLIVDDDKDIRNLLRIVLQNANYEVLEAVNGDEAVALCGESDLILLDVMMPGKDGFTVCREIREKTRAPILFLTAKGQEYDKIIGFSAGGDDYIVKPFVPSELLARVSAQLRRYLDYGGRNSAQSPNVNRIRINELLIDEDSCKVTVNGNEINLTATEYRILLLLCKTKGKVFSVQNIYESIWEEPYFHTANNTVMVHIRKLREKIETDPQKPKYIKTVWGMGYKVEY